MNLTNLLNGSEVNWFFSFVLPFLLVYWIVFKICNRTRWLSSEVGRNVKYDDNSTLSAIVAAVIGLLAISLSLAYVIVILIVLLIVWSIVCKAYPSNGKRAKRR